MPRNEPVTIGLPFYNCEETLSYALQSVFAQTDPDWQLLLVDDGSTDGSLAIAGQVRPKGAAQAAALTTTRSQQLRKWPRSNAGP